MQTHEPAGEHAAEEMITIPREALLADDWLATDEEEGGVLLRLEARSQGAWLASTDITVTIEPHGISDDTGARQVQVELVRDGEPLHMSAHKTATDGVMFEVPAQDLERLVRTLARTVERARRLGLVPGTGDARVAQPGDLSGG